ncbi:MAG TPA: DUF917 domain-containing protein [Thermomicrobiales bacterium]|jgi:hypothetical protein|nr:DUF917 domain-containing protein [Thermomicrobiales bacterium]
MTTGSPLTEVTSELLNPIAIGAGILGTGGGGNPYLGRISTQLIMGETGSVPVVPMHDLPDDALVVSAGGMGSPTIGIERVGTGLEGLRALRALERHLGRRATHITPGEIGGSNCIAPIRVAFQAGLPVVDCDAMGRAFPELGMDTFAIYGIRPTPAALSDHHGHTVIFDDLADPDTLERYARAVTIQMGGAAGYSFPPMTGAEVKRCGIAGTMTLALRIGEAVIAARRAHTDPIDATLGVTGGLRLFTGKITDVDRRLVGGFARGSLTLDGAAGDTGRTLGISFQNENLIATDETGRVICSVPDLICIVDTESGEPITTEILRYGLRVTVLGIPAPELIKTPKALQAVGPAAFGYPDVEYVPMAGVYGQPGA